MPKSKQPTLESPIGIMVFGNLVKPEEDLSGRPVWQGSLRIPMDQSERLLQAIADAVESKQQEDKSFPDVTDPKLKKPYKPALDRDPENPEAPKTESKTDVLFKFTRKLEWKDKSGKTHQRSAPTLYDAAGKVVNDQLTEVPWGSTGRFFFVAIPYDFRGSKGVSLGLEAFQIKELREVSSQINAAPIEGGWIAPASDEVDMNEMAALLAD